MNFNLKGKKSKKENKSTIKASFLNIFRSIVRNGNRTVIQSAIQIANINIFMDSININMIEQIFCMKKSKLQNRNRFENQQNSYKKKLKQKLKMVI